MQLKDLLLFFVICVFFYVQTNKNYICVRFIKNSLSPLNSFANGESGYRKFYPLGEHKLSQSEFTSFALLQATHQTHTHYKICSPNCNQSDIAQISQIFAH